MSLKEEKPRMGTRKVSKMWFMALLLVVFVAGCGRERGVLLPTLSSISPNRGIQGQAVGVTLTGTNFATGATVNVSGTLVTVSNTTVVSTTQITATFTIDKTAAVGDRAVSVTTSGLTTSAVTFTVAPPLTVSSTVPANSAVGVAVNQALTVTFGEALDCSTVTTSTFTVTGPAGAVTGTIACAGTSATFTPTSILASNSVYTATLTTGIKDSEADPLYSNFVWSFTTAPPPTVISTIPPNGATGVPTDLPLTATFSQGMNCSTITPLTFIVTGPAGGITGTIACLGTSATFTPSSSLAINTTYTATITTGVTNVAGAALASNFVWSFRTGSTSGAAAPTVTFTDPANNATGVPINKKITATFSQAMAPATITTTTFTVVGSGSTPVAGTVTYDVINNIATFTPASNLATSTIFTATITTGVTNLAGTEMAINFVWGFKTGATADTTPPTVTSTIPASGATGVPINQIISATFSKAMDPSTISTATFTLTGPGTTPVSGAVAYAALGTAAIFTPTSNLAPNTTFTATITTGVQDVAGNALASNYVWSFTTGSTADTTPPTVTSTNPANGATGVCINKTVNATFSKAMDPLTINTATFTLAGPASAAVTGTVSYNATSNVATFTPASNLAPNTPFTATITTGVTDLAGNALESDFVWMFTTGATACQAPVALGAAATFGGFGGGAGMTNQGILTVINGDIGTTGVSTTMTGFHDAGPGCVYTETPLNIGKVNGKIYTAPPPPTVACPSEGTAVTFAIATQAAADALTAYNSLVAQPGGPDPGSGQLGGLVLAPGTYTSAAGTFMITGSDLTLDAQGDTNAVWVFQMASSLTVGAAGAPRSVILVNGAQAKNVFWQVGSAATINGAGGGTMVGTIIASAGITFSTAGNLAITTLNGRALALNASVTMVNTVINVPGP
ncbi:MAG: Ig-like domain-containing protein [Terriglobia bacterium]